MWRILVYWIQFVPKVALQHSKDAYFDALLLSVTLDYILYSPHAGNFTSFSPRNINSDHVVNSF